MNERGKESGVSTRDGKLSLEYEDLGGGHFRDVTIDAGAEIDRRVLHKRVRLPGPSKP